MSLVLGTEINPSSQGAHSLIAGATIHINKQVNKMWEYTKKTIMGDKDKCSQIPRLMSEGKKDLVNGYFYEE